MLHVLVLSCRWLTYCSDFVEWFRMLAIYVSHLPVCSQNLNRAEQNTYMTSCIQAHRHNNVFHLFSFTDTCSTSMMCISLYLCNKLFYVMRSPANCESIFCPWLNQGVSFIASDILPIIIGVPQGWVLWQLIFIIYTINYYPQASIFYFSTYADDTILRRMWYLLAAVHTISVVLNKWSKTFLK